MASTPTTLLPLQELSTISRKGPVFFNSKGNAEEKRQGPQQTEGKNERLCFFRARHERDLGGKEPQVHRVLKVLLRAMEEDG